MDINKYVITAESDNGTLFTVGLKACNKREANIRMGAKLTMLKDTSYVIIDTKLSNDENNVICTKLIIGEDDE